MRISSLSVDFCMMYVSVVQDSPQGGSQHELVDWCGKMLKDRKVFLSVLHNQGLLVQEHNYSSHHTHPS